MNIAVIAGSTVGTKTRIAADYTVKKVREQYPDAIITLLD